MPVWSWPTALSEYRDIDRYRTCRASDPHNGQMTNSGDALSGVPAVLLLMLRVMPALRSCGQFAGFCYGMNIVLLLSDS